MTNDYLFALIRNGEHIDSTSLDEDDHEFAEDLFFNEFGYDRLEGDEVELIWVD